MIERIIQLNLKASMSHIVKSSYTQGMWIQPGIQVENHISSQTCRWKSGGRVELSEKGVPNGDNRSPGFSVLSREG